MKPLRLSAVLLGLVLALGLAACGGGSGDVPDDAVAVVGDTEIPRSELDTLVSQTKKYYEATKQTFPKVGTPEYQQIQQQNVAFLVQKTEFEQAAEDLGIEITDADITKAREEFVKNRFGGDEKKFEKALAEQGVTDKSFEDTLRMSVLSQKIFEAVTKDVKVTDAEAFASYQQNQDQYQTRESRDVRHILIAEKKSNGDVDFAKSQAEANRIYQELRGGADFAALAKRYSDDPGSKESGGKLTITRGQTVPEFDKTAFQLKTGALSQPVKTQYGYHVIEALTDVKPAKVTPYEDVKSTIKASLVQERKNTEMTQWVQDLQKRYEGKVSYAAGFEPPALPETTDSGTTTTQ